MRAEAQVVAVIGCGGAFGTLARYGLEDAFPAGLNEFPWVTLCVNLVGCLLIGVMLHIVTERPHPGRLLRPFLAVGVLGGFTTFSTLAVEVVQRVADHPRTAGLYVVASLVLGPLAVLAGMAAVRRVHLALKPRSNW